MTIQGSSVTAQTQRSKLEKAAKQAAASSENRGVQTPARPVRKAPRLSLPRLKPKAAVTATAADEIPKSA